MDRAKAIKKLEQMRDQFNEEWVDFSGVNEALDLAIKALGQTEIVRCKDCKHYNPPHIEYNDGTRKDYPDASVTVDIGTNVGGKCENSTTTMRTYCLAHHREDPDDFEELVIFREPMEYCSFGEKAEKHQLTGETSTNKGDAESATTTDCISREQVIKTVHKYFVDEINKSPYEIDEDGDEVYTDMKAVNELLKHNKHISKAIKALPPVNQKQITGKLESAENAALEGEESTMNQPRSKVDCISRQQAVEAVENICNTPCNEYFVKAIESLPPVTPTERTGEWIYGNGNGECSVCGREKSRGWNNYCGYCGAKMR